MVRAVIASVLGFILIVVESMIVIALKGSGTVVFNGIAPFVSIWAMNFFFAYAILTQITNWYVNKYDLEEDNIY
ncbi:hypothetical protein HPT25_10995 [Bacillus sp. BRMEA1]|uniref:hypothetical protein n=1 Tax=Neobacillus endophyticus TaxID=2738405 RepID=UPI00156666B9|nr:hypothetical protein [Neobacillus endophyticus]NRD77909.1 hypothetical protein [Neobacillus endophyticus]